MSTLSPSIEEGYTSADIADALRKLKPESLAIFTYAISSEAEADDEAIQRGRGS